MPESNNWKPPYKTENNRWLTKALFWEQAVLNTPISERYSSPPVFSLYDDKKGLVNARKTFVELGDPTGYKWAITYLGDYDHWQALLKKPWFREALDVWVTELNAKLLGEAIEVYRYMARAGETETTRMQAAKYLAEQPWNKATKGRPSKADVESQIKLEARKRSVEDDDMERIGLRAVK